MERYIFSGSLTESMHDYLLNIPDFEPMSCLTTQLDRPGIKKYIQWIKEGREDPKKKICDWYLVDSGAFSIHTGNAKKPVNEFVEDYISFLNEIDDYFDACAQVDTIPGKFQQPKTPQDYVESADKSWENFLYMRSKLKSPDKLMPVFHYGESFDALKRMLEWRGENGEKLQYLGLSPANDVTTEMRNVYLVQANDIIASSSNPEVKTHLYGYTSLEGLSKIKCYSADSISHRHIAAYCKILSPTFGVISVTKKSRTVKNKSSLSFLDTAGPEDLAKLEAEIKHCNMTLEQIQEDSSARVAFTIWAIQRLIKTKYKYDNKKLVRVRKLF